MKYNKEKFIYQGFDDYNKDLISHRLDFFNNYQNPDLFLNFINSLDFNTNINSKNYRWGQRFFSKESQSFKWISTTENTISVKKYNHKSCSYENVQKNALISKNEINEHFLSCFKNKRMISFAYKDIDPKTRISIKNELINLYMIDKKTYGLSQNNDSDILWLDIDNHNSSSNPKENLKTILDFLGLKPNDLLYIEQNVISGGIHAMLKLPFRVTNESFYIQLEQQLKLYASEAECNFQSKLLRLPLSFEYVAITPNNNIFDDIENIFIDKKYWVKSFGDINLNKKAIKSSFLANLYYDLSKKRINGLKKAKYLADNKYKEECKQYWNTPKTLFYRDNKKLRVSDKKIYNIGLGERWAKTKVIVPYLKMHGYSLNQVVDTILEHNEGSKDLSKWSKAKLYKEIKPFYEKCDLPMLNLQNHSSSFVSNINKLNDVTKSFFDRTDVINHLTKKFSEIYCKISNYKNKRLSEEKEDVLKLMLPEYYKEIIGSMIFNISDTKTCSLKDVKVGYQLSDTQLKLIQDNIISRLNLQDNVLAKTNLQYLKKALLLSLNLTEDNNKHILKNNWIKGFCKSYNIHSLNDIMNVLNHIYNSINYNNIIKSFISYNNFNKYIIILFISLIEKSIFFEKWVEKYQKDDVPIPI